MANIVRILLDRSDTSVHQQHLSQAIPTLIVSTNRTMIWIKGSVHTGTPSLCPVVCQHAHR
jgi:hypothetical protein